MAADHSVRAISKQATAPFASRLARGLKNCRDRLSIWFDIARSARGRTAADQRAVRHVLLGAPIDMCRDLRRWWDPKLSRDAEVTIKGLGHFHIRKSSDDFSHVLPGSNSAIFAAVQRLLKVGDTAVDAGANIGAIAVKMASCVGMSGRVIAVEMMPDTAKRLRHNMRLNGLDQVCVIEKALSHRRGDIVAATVEPGMYGQASIVSDKLPGSRCAIEVQTTTLDALTEGIGEIALLKMDLEGAEPLALRGAASMLNRTRYIIFESWSADGRETGTMLQARGFSVAPLDGRNFLASRESRSV